MWYRSWSIFRYKVGLEVLTITPGSASAFKENVFHWRIKKYIYAKNATCKETLTSSGGTTNLGVHFLRHQKTYHNNEISCNKKSIDGRDWLHGTVLVVTDMQSSIYFIIWFFERPTIKNVHALFLPATSEVFERGLIPHDTFRLRQQGPVWVPKMSQIFFFKKGFWNYY